MLRQTACLPDTPEGRRVFATCSARDLNRIQRRGTQLTVAPGTVIHAHDHRANWLYIVLSGTAVAHDRGRNHTLRAGDVHGARALLVGDEVCGTLVARSDVGLLVIGRREFNALLNESAGFAHGIARHLAERLTPAHGRALAGLIASDCPRARP